MSVLTKNIKRIMTPLLFTAAVVVSQVGMMLPAHAAPGTATWTGTAGDGKFSTAGNWAENAVPEDGAELIFNSEPEDGSEYVTNDLTDVEFSKVTVDDSALADGAYGNYYIEDNALELQDGASLEQNGYNLGLNFSSGIHGAGSLTLINWNISDDATVAGELTSHDSYGSLGGDYGIKGITSLVLAGSSSFYVEGNVSFPITVQENANASLTFDGECLKSSGNSCVKWKDITRTVSGDLTLNSNLTVYVNNNVTAKFTGDKTGAGKIVRDKYSSYKGTLIVDGKKLVNPTKTTKLSGTKTGFDGYVYVVDNETAVLNGKRANAYVYGGGLLKGTGTTEYLYVLDGGVVAPGNSPGKITVLEDLNLQTGSTYQAEIFDAKHYDQIKAGTVYITGADLELSFSGDGKIKKGDKFTLINNTGDDPITGTFAGIDEGDKITLGKAVFAVTYKGGAGGNDFVLTALNDATAPGAPNTSYRPTTLANPAIVAIIGLVAAGGALYLRHRATK